MAKNSKLVLKSSNKYFFAQPRIIKQCMLVLLYQIIICLFVWWITGANINADPIVYCIICMGLAVFYVCVFVSWRHAFKVVSLNADGIKCGKVFLRWENIRTYRFEDIYWICGKWRKIFKGTVICFNANSTDSFLRHEKNAIYVYKSEKLLEVLKIYSTPKTKVFDAFFN